MLWVLYMYVSMVFLSIFDVCCSSNLWDMLVVEWHCSQSVPGVFCRTWISPVICRDSIVSSCATNKKTLGEVQRHPSGLRLTNWFPGFHEVFFVIIPPGPTNISPENWWLEDAVSFENGPFFRGHVKIFRGVTGGSTFFKRPCIHLRSK